MEELTTLTKAITQGQWLAVKNGDSTISLVVRPNPLTPDEVQVIIEVGGLTPEETTANTKLIMVAQEAIPKLLNLNELCTTALTAALKVLEVGSVTIEAQHQPEWDALTTALAAIGVQPK